MAQPSPRVFLARRTHVNASSAACGLRGNAPAPVLPVCHGGRLPLRAHPGGHRPPGRPVDPTTNSTTRRTSPSCRCATWSRRKRPWNRSSGHRRRPPSNADRTAGLPLPSLRHRGTDRARTPPATIPSVKLNPSLTDPPGRSQVTINPAEGGTITPRRSRQRHCPRRNTAGHRPDRHEDSR